MHTEWLDMAAMRSSQRYARMLSLILLAGLIFSFMQLQQPRLEVPPIQRLVLDMRDFRELPPPEPDVKQERLLANESPFVIQDPPKPEPEVRLPEPPPPPEPIKKLEKKPEPAPKPVAKQQKRVVPKPAVRASAPAPEIAAPIANHAPASTSINNADKQSALAALVQEIERRKKYPKQARRIGAQGTVTLAIRVGVDGRVSNCSVAKGSGVGILDLETGKLGSKLVGFSTGVSGSAFTVNVPVRYTLQ